MDWDSYKRACDLPGVFSGWMLTQTLVLLADRMGENREVVQVIESALASPALLKPVDHQGGQDTDMFVLELTADQARAVLAEVRAAVRSGATTSRTRDRGLGGFVEAWAEYVEHIEKTRT